MASDGGQEEGAEVQYRGGTLAWRELRQECPVMARIGEALWCIPDTSTDAERAISRMTRMESNKQMSNSGQVWLHARMMLLCNRDLCTSMKERFLRKRRRKAAAVTDAISCATRARAEVAGSGSLRRVFVAAGGLAGQQPAEGELSGAAEAPGKRPCRE